MKRVNVAEASGPVLDWLVAKCEGREAAQIKANGPVHLKGVVGHKPLPYAPSSDWSIAGPIIERENITVGPWDTSPCMAHLGPAETVNSRNPRMTGPTLLVAAMRCYVRSKLGDEAEVPEELT